MMSPPGRLLLLSLFCLIIISIFYYFRFKSQEQIRIEKDGAIFVEFSPCFKEPKILIASPGNKIKDIFNSVNCGIKPINSEIMDEEVKSGDRIFLDSSGILHKSRMDGYKLFTLGLKIPLNEATEGEIAQIPGIGEELARRIVNERNTPGKFKDFQDLLKVKGVGRAKLEMLKEYTFIE